MCEGHRAGNEGKNAVLSEQKAGRYEMKLSGGWGQTTQVCGPSEGLCLHDKNGQVFCAEKSHPPT